MQNNVKTEKEIKGILQQYSAILTKLKSIDVLRTNNIVGEYGEWLVENKLGYTRVKQNNVGYDAIDGSTKYQIKSRLHLDNTKNNYQEMGAVDLSKGQYFDYMIAIVFDKNFDIEEAYKIPFNTIKALSKDGAYRIKVKLSNIDYKIDITSLLD